jgi:sodium-dependent phosphate cotransporter
LFVYLLTQFSFFRTSLIFPLMSDVHAEHVHEELTGEERMKVAAARSMSMPSLPPLETLSLALVEALGAGEPDDVVRCLEAEPSLDEETAKQAVFEFRRSMAATLDPAGESPRGAPHPLVVTPAADIAVHPDHAHVQPPAPVAAEPTRRSRHRTRTGSAAVKSRRSRSGTRDAAHRVLVSRRGTDGGALSAQAVEANIAYDEIAEPTKADPTALELKPFTWRRPWAYTTSRIYAQFAGLPEWGRSIVLFFCVLLALYMFFVGLGLLGMGFQALGSQVTSQLNELTSNPITAFLVGVLLTVLLQSSSTTTSIIVTTVGSGALDTTNAVFMIMGANAGTSVSSTFVSLAQSGDRREFSRAFSGATIHDCFNLLSVAILLPIEVATSMLNHLTVMIVEGRGDVEPDAVAQGKFKSPISIIAGPVEQLFLVVDKASIKANMVDGKVVIGGLFGPESWSDTTSGIVTIIFAVLLLSATLVWLVKLLRIVLQGRARSALIRALDYNALVNIIIGMGITIAVQSSSITTSTLVPLVGVGAVTLEQSFPLVIGANLGTTCTAFLAAFTAGSDAALQVALAHLFFNILGTLIWFPVPFMRRVPIGMARWLGLAAARRRWVALAYILFVFFVFPLTLLGLSAWGTAPLAVGISLVVAAILALIWIKCAPTRFVPNRVRDAHMPCREPKWCPTFLADSGPLEWDDGEAASELQLSVRAAEEGDGARRVTAPAPTAAAKMTRSRTGTGSGSRRHRSRSRAGSSRAHESQNPRD